MKGIGVSSWTIPFEGEELFRWAKEQGLDTISPGFDYDACRTEAGMHRWCRTWSELSEKYGIALSILGVNTLCEAVSYTHLDVYKRQIQRGASGILDVSCCKGK